MQSKIFFLLVAGFFLTTVLHALDCAKEQDSRSNKDAGLLISSFTITGTQALTSEELGPIESKLRGSCIDENPDELGERVRDLFQNRGYFGAVISNVEIKLIDPLARPKTVRVEANVKEGPRYRLGQIEFISNRAFSSTKLRSIFPSKKGDLFERNKIGGGIEALVRLYGSEGFLDFTAIPDTEMGDRTVNLTITINEGTQYHMGKIDILAKAELAEKLQTLWLLQEGKVFDLAYIDKFITANSSLLPQGFTGQSVQRVRNCHQGVVDVRMLIDPALAMQSRPEDVNCESSNPSK